MKIRLIFVLLMTVILAGCGPNYVDYFPYHDDGRMKPHVALLPIFDNLNVQLPTNVAGDMTSTIYYISRDDGQLYLLPYSDIQAGMSKIGNVNFYETDQALVEEFSEADFIVMIELVGHNIESASDSCTGLSKLVMKARIKIIDARCRNLKIALQEILVRDYMVPGVPSIYEPTDQTYQNSYVKAHRGFADAIAKRMEEVIRTAF